MKILMCPGRLVLLGVVVYAALGVGAVHAQEIVYAKNGSQPVYAKEGSLVFAQFQPFKAWFEKLTVPVVAPCDEGGPLVDLIFRNHFRSVTKAEEKVERWKKAFVRQFEFLKLPDGISPQDLGQQISATIPSSALVQGHFAFNCAAAAQIAQAFRGQFTVGEVWDAFLNALLSELDPHSHVAGEARAQQIDDDIQGEHVGIGVSMKKEEGKIIILEVIAGSPAQEAGIQVGDQILSYTKNGVKTSIADIGLREFVQAISSSKDQALELEVERDNEELVLTVTPKKIEIRYVQARPIGDILYIRLGSFGGRAVEQLEEAVAGHPDIRSIILDLRFNPGGRVDIAQKIVDLFVNTGVVASSWNGLGKMNRNYLYRADNKGLITDVPMAVLINDYSASAAELLAQNLKDYGRAVVVGRPSWGKGSMGLIYRLPAGRYLVLTEYMYYTMKGISPHAIRVQPHIETFDNLMDEVFRRRRAMQEMGVPVPPISEIEIPYALPANRRLNQDELEEAGGVEEANPLETILTSLNTEPVMISQGEVLQDTTLAVAEQVVRAYAKQCRTYEVRNCQSRDGIRVASGATSLNR